MFSQIPDQPHHPRSQRPELLPILVPVEKLGEQRTGPTQIFRLLQAVGRQAGGPHSPRLLRTVQSSDQQIRPIMKNPTKKHVFINSNSFPWPNPKTICTSVSMAFAHPSRQFLPIVQVCQEPFEAGKTPFLPGGLHRATEQAEQQQQHRGPHVGTAQISCRLPRV